MAANSSGKTCARFFAHAGRNGKLKAPHPGGFQNGLRQRVPGILFEACCILENVRFIDAGATEDVGQCRASISEPASFVEDKPNDQNQTFMLNMAFSSAFETFNRPCVHDNHLAFMGKRAVIHVTDEFTFAGGAKKATVTPVTACCLPKGENGG